MARKSKTKKSAKEIFDDQFKTRLHELFPGESQAGILRKIGYENRTHWNFWFGEGKYLPQKAIDRFASVTNTVPIEVKVSGGDKRYQLGIEWDSDKSTHRYLGFYDSIASFSRSKKLDSKLSIPSDLSGPQKKEAVHAFLNDSKIDYNLLEPNKEDSVCLDDYLPDGIFYVGDKDLLEELEELTKRIGYGGQALCGLPNSAISFESFAAVAKQKKIYKQGFSKLTQIHSTLSKRLEDLGEK